MKKEKEQSGESLEGLKSRIARDILAVQGVRCKCVLLEIPPDLAEGPIKGDRTEFLVVTCPSCGKEYSPEYKHWSYIPEKVNTMKKRVLIEQLRTGLCSKECIDQYPDLDPEDVDFGMGAEITVNMGHRKGKLWNDKLILLQEKDTPFARERAKERRLRNRI